MIRKHTSLYTLLNTEKQTHTNIYTRIRKSDLNKLMRLRKISLHCETVVPQSHNYIHWTRPMQLL